MPDAGRSALKGPQETMAYGGRKKCGCLVAAVVDRGTPEMAPFVGISVAEMNQDGLEVERMTVQDVRDQLRVCRCDPARPGQEVLAV